MPKERTAATLEMHALQILHYQAGEQYTPHFDYFFDEVRQRACCARQRPCCARVHNGRARGAPPPTRVPLLLPALLLRLLQVNQRNGGQRIATALLYLTDVEEGACWRALAGVPAAHAAACTCHGPGWCCRCVRPRPAGGETVFPDSKEKPSEQEATKFSGTCPASVCTC